jgi:hypothetical protein
MTPFNLLGSKLKQIEPFSNLLGSKFKQIKSFTLPSHHTSLKASSRGLIFMNVVCERESEVQ